jgi:hypothetical protein
VALHTWHRVTVSINEAYTVSVTLDDVPLFTYTDPSPAHNLAKGFVGLGSGWHQTQFDDISVSM